MPLAVGPFLLFLSAWILIALVVLPVLELLFSCSPIYPHYHCLSHPLPLASHFAGGIGMSVLDHKPQRFVDFDAMIADPSWLHKLGSSITDAQQEELLAAMERIIANEEANEGPETAIAGRIDGDKLLLHSIVEFNTALYEGANGKEEKERAARGLDDRAGSAPVRDPSIRLPRRPAPKKENPVYSMKSIKYKGGQKPAVLNVSTVEFQKMLERFNMKVKPTASGRLTLDAHGRSTFASQDASGGANQQLLRSELDALQGMDKEQLIAMLLAERGGHSNSAPSPQQQPACNLLAPMGATPRVGSASGARPSGSNAAVLQRAAQLPPLPEGVELNSVLESIVGDKAVSSREAAANVSARPSLPVSGTVLQNNMTDALTKPQSANSLLAPIQIPTSPIKSARGSRPPSSLLSLSADAGSDFVIPQSGGISPLGAQAAKVPSKVPTPRASSGGMSKSASAPLLLTGAIGSRAGSRSGQSQTLGKLSINNSTGNTFSLSKPRLRDIRALRDHLMSTSGSFTLNVNPDSSPDAQTEVQESIAVTKEMVRDTMMKNKIDQIQSLIETPGYYEAVGPAHIFMSDVRQSFQDGPAFQSAVRAADVTKGIKRDELRVWSEDGIKNKIQIFAAGGAMKMS